MIMHALKLNLNEAEYRFYFKTQFNSKHWITHLLSIHLS